MSPIEPLDDADFNQMPLGTRAERFWGKVPVLGWMISDSLWTYRHRPLHNRYVEQIEQRPDTGPLWKGDAFYREVAAVVCEAAKVEMPWPNDHFIPEDPFRVVFWSFHDGLDMECAMIYVQDKLGIDVKEEHLARYFEGTLGDFVNDLCARVRYGEHTEPGRDKTP